MSDYGYDPATPSKKEVTEMMTKPESPIVNPGLMPPPLPVEELRYYPTDAEVRKGNRWHTIPVEAVTIESARDGTVTVGISGYFGNDDAHLYELDLTPSAAERLALRLVRRAHDIHADEAVDEAVG